MHARLQSLEHAEAEAGLGSWSFDLQTGGGWWSQSMYTLFGVEPSDGVPSIDDYLALIHPEDRELLAQTMGAFAQGVPPQKREFRTNPERGPTRILRPGYHVEHDEAGNAHRLVGTVLDVTEPRQAEAALQQSDVRYRHLFETMAQGVIYLDADGSIIDANPAAQHILRLSLDQLRGRSALHPPWSVVREDGTDFPGDLHPAAAALRSGVAVRDEVMGVRNPDSDTQRWLSINATPLFHPGATAPYQVYTTIEDITARKANEAALEHAASRLRLLADASAAFAAVGMDEKALLDNLARRTADALGSSSFVRLRTDDDPWLAVAAAYDSDPATREAMGAIFSRTRVHIDDPHPAALVVRSGQPRLTPELDLEALRATLAPEFWPVLDRVRLRSEIIVPLQVHGQTVGCLVFIRHGPEQPAFTQDDLTLAQDLADRAGLALANTRLYRDVHAAEQKAQQAHARLESLITSLPTGVSYLDQDLRYQLVNPALAVLNGYSPAAHLGQPVAAIVPALAPRIEPLLRQVLATGTTVSNLELQDKRPSTNDDPRTWLVSYFPVPGPEGEIAGVGVTLTDITASRRTEAALQASMTTLKAALDSMTDAIFITDAKGRLIEFNEAFAVFHRFPGKQECPETLDVFPALFEVTRLTGEVVPVEQWAVSLALRGETATNAEYILRRKDTGATWVGSYSFASVRDPDGAVAGAVVISRDITASKEAELRLRQSEARFATIFEYSPVALGIMRLSDSKFTEVNAASLTLYGYPREAITGHTALELGIWTNPEQRQHALQQLHAHQRITNFEATVRTASGAERPVLLSAEVVSIHNEPHVLTQVIDITALKVAQQELQELNRTLEERVQARTAEVLDLYDRAPTGYYSLDAEGHITRINQTLLDWLGYAREEVLGHAFSDLIIPEYRASFGTNFRSFKKRGQLSDLDGVLLRKDGSTFPVLINATAIYSAEGTYVSSRATVFDNTERKQAEDALRESEAQNRLLFEESPAAVALFDQHNRIVRANRAFAQLAGYPIEHLRGQQVDTLGLLSPAQLAQLTAEVGSALKHGSGFAEAVVGFKRASGEVQVVEVRTFALTIHGQWHSLVSVHDITRERQTEETLRRANAELARAARAKDEFLANMSHELRTPLNAILGYSESLQDAIYDSLTPRQHNVIDTVVAAGQHLLTLINDILDLAKVETGQLKLQTRRVSVHELCQASLMFVHEQALKKGLRLSLQLNDQEATLDVDPTRLKQMLVNLLSNAVKFTPDGGTVGLDVTVDRTEGVAQFVVHDTGIGIAPEDLGRLFQPFSQVDASLDREHEGTGLGLALVRRLAELHGGSVTVESEVGTGSRFTITLPDHEPSPAEPSEGASLTAHPAAPEPEMDVDTVRGRILLAEDNEANSDALSDYLRARGYEVCIARDGHDALARADEVQPQLILMDIQMPRLDGLEAIRRLRALPAHAVTPIIALTALAMPGDEARCLEAGATAYLTKPVRLRTLAEMIQQLLVPWR
ncbi:MAG: PAS domain S-box protein [Chloroflexales bacterium]|nr:PAS domain S-box protein [Chloroflexales bacterium]